MSSKNEEEEAGRGQTTICLVGLVRTWTLSAPTASPTLKP